MKLSDSCFAVFGLGYCPPWVVNAGFIVGTDKTLIVDSGPNYLSAQTIYGYAKNMKPDNELFVINTEKHFDHVGGNSFFKDKKIKIYSHVENFRTEEDFLEEKNYFNSIIDNVKRREAGEEKIFFQNTRIVQYDISITEEKIFYLGGDIEANIIFTPGHTLANLSVYLPKSKVLYCGDCIVNGYLPNLEGGSENDWRIWLESLDKISSLELNYIMPGHGNVITGAAINREIDRMKSIINESIILGKPPTQ